MVINLDFNTYSPSEILNQLRESVLVPWIANYANFLEEFISNKELTIHTSGTTGERKKMLVTRHQMQLSANATLAFFNLCPGDHVFLNLSCEFIAGKMMLIRAIEGKLNCFLAEPASDPSDKIDKQFSFAPFVPLQIKSLLTSGKISHFDKVLIGGGKVDEDLINELIKSGANAFESFGMTETLTHFAIKKVSPKKEESFTVLNGFEISKSNSNNLVIESNPITGRKITTNDIIDLKGKNNFIWKGRSDNLINSGGVKLIPEEIETKISKHISVPFVLVGLADEILGEKIVLVLESTRTVDLNIINTELEKFEKIKTQKCLDRFPRTISGKIKRKEIIKLLSA